MPLKTGPTLSRSFRKDRPRRQISVLRGPAITRSYPVSQTTTGQARPTSTMDHSWNAGVLLTVPLFSGFLTDHQSAEAKSNLYITEGKRRVPETADTARCATGISEPAGSGGEHCNGRTCEPRRPRRTWTLRTADMRPEWEAP